MTEHTTTEHWDNLSITVIFDHTNAHSVTFKAVKIEATDIEENGTKHERGYARKGGTSNLDLVYDPNDAERYVEGFVKWDGCSHFYFGDGDNDGYLHLCGAEGITELSKALIRIFNRCGEMMGNAVLELTFPAVIK